MCFRGHSNVINTSNCQGDRKDSRRGGGPRRTVRGTNAIECSDGEMILIRAATKWINESGRSQPPAITNRYIKERIRARSQKATQRESGFKHFFTNFFFGILFYLILIGIWVYK